MDLPIKAAVKEGLSSIDPLIIDCKPFFRNLLTWKWQTDSLKLGHPHPLQMKNSFMPYRYSCLLKRHNEVVLFRLKIGHTRLTHGHLMSKNESPICARCRIVITINQFMSKIRESKSPFTSVTNVPSQPLFLTTYNTLIPFYHFFVKHYLLPLIAAHRSPDKLTQSPSQIVLMPSLHI